MNSINNGIYNPWADWKITELIGKGAYGAVFKAVRQDVHTGDKYAAIKILNASSYNVNEVINEINTLCELKNSPNTLYIEDYKVIENGNNYNIYIRTALLTTLESYRRIHHFTEQDVIKLGIDICNALIVCHDKNIIHRDIKPSNILFNKENNSFYLCDFGIAKKFDTFDGHKIIAGTPAYIAPEVYKGVYNKKVDIYSLGLVLYYLMNNYYLPFSGNGNEIESVREKNINLQPPANASKEFSHIILKACAYLSADRFDSIEDLKKALEEVKNGTYDLTKYMPTIQANRKNIDEEVDYSNFDESIFKTTYLKNSKVGMSYNKVYERVSDSRTTIPANEARNIECEPFEEEKDYKSKVPFFICAILIILLFIAGLVIYKNPKNKKSNKSDISVNEIVAEEETEFVTEEITIDNTEEIEKAITAIINDSDALQEANNYDEALSKIQEGLELYPDSEKLKKEKEDISSKITIIHENEAALKSAKEMADNNDLVSALHLLDDTLEKSERNGISDANITEKAIEYNVAYTNQVAEQVNEYTKNNNFDAAIETLTNALAEFPDYIIFSTKLDEVKNAKATFELNQKKEQILKEAEELFNSQEYEQAIKKLQSVPELSSDSDIQAKIAEFKEYEPVSLFNLIELNKYELKNWADSLIDTFRNDYTGTGRIFSLCTYTGLEGGSGDEYTFYTENKYTKLKGKCAVHEDFKGEAELMVYGGKEGYYGDNSNLLYKIKVDRSTKPFDIDVDISNLEWITIDFYYVPRVSTKGQLLCIDWSVCK